MILNTNEIQFTMDENKYYLILNATEKSYAIEKHRNSYFAFPHDEMAGYMKSVSGQP